VNGDITQEHYARLAATYDENYAYSPASLEWMTGCILRRLRLGPGDVVADIGCGTGLFARGLAEHVRVRAGDGVMSVELDAEAPLRELPRSLPTAATIT
jgi:ubiquinone/menaquinone biosynthesis C-methylase UbiE